MRTPKTDKERWEAAWQAGYKTGKKAADRQLAEDVLSLADDAGMPDSYKDTDSRMQRARDVLEAGVARGKEAANG